jgi:hypothetical protein
LCRASRGPRFGLEPKSSARPSKLGVVFHRAVVTCPGRVCIPVAALLTMSELNLTVVQMRSLFNAFAEAHSIFEVPTGWMDEIRAAEGC